METKSYFVGMRFRKWVASLWRGWRERLSAGEPLWLLALAVAIGALSGYGAVVFRLLIGWLQNIFWHHAYVTPELLHAQPRWVIVITPALGGLIVGFIVYHFASEARGHGVPEVMAAVALRNGVIRPRVALAKILSAALTISSGGSAGREGPIVQIGAALASSLGQLLKVPPAVLRTMVASGAAGGIAATFNAPIAGALFSIEVILGEIGLAQFTPVIISSVMATTISRYYLGPQPVFHVPPYELVGPSEFVSYALLGIWCALASVVFIFALDRAEGLAEKLTRLPSFTLPMFAGLLVGVMGLFVPEVFSDGHAMIDRALRDPLLPGFALVLLLAKIMATVLTLGSGGSGGVFAPSLFMGAMTGAAWGNLCGRFFPGQTGSPASYALVGMAGVVAGTTRAPISAILIIFEMTNSYAAILPLMLVATVSLLLSARLSPESIYTIKLVRRGIRLLRGQSVDVLRGHKVARFMRSDFDPVPEDESIQQVQVRLETNSAPIVYAVDRDGRFAGAVPAHELLSFKLSRTGLDRALLVEDFLHTTIPTCEPEEDLTSALLKFARQRWPELPVLAPNSRKLLGVLHYADVMAIYQAEVLNRETAQSLFRMVSSPGLARVEVAPEYSLAEWSPPAPFHGVTLQLAELPRRYGVHVVLVKRTRGAEVQIVPTLPGPDYVIQKHDVLVVYGRNEDIERLPN